MQPNDNLSKAIETANKYGRFYCKFISANDVGLTKAHQEGLYISVHASQLFFDTRGKKGENKDHFIKIHVDGYYPFQSRAIWYGSKTRKEYRLTRFWTNSPFNKYEQVGNLIIFIQASMDDFYCFILENEDEIETFLEVFSISLVKNNAVYGLDIEEKETKIRLKLLQVIDEYSRSFSNEFPATVCIADKARELFYKIIRGNLSNPDNALIRWIDLEYEVFKAIEKNIYKPYLTEPFGELELLFEFANSALNRRKSRAGKSLEHHIDFMLTKFNIPFSHPGKTEGNKKPDFLLPSNEAYANILYDEKKLTFLGAKTTCKDRWRQILNEANRIPEKHLLTLQQGITKNQMEEMQEEKVILVVPKAYHDYYPPEYKDRILSITTFVQYLKEKYAI
ncbi:restriction endonuclease [Bacillus sp. V3-13]|uniref:type II restriction endonuclease n=1 Tax=Bacillus sp. V3-13 TaxID=2053728 RepID=UPI000C77E3FE|nr:type II restriction endonuclease [Bacillus sp. V3-13]PLR75730.1 restriction endonuclease [Bacillus sp. V3-13]